MSHIALAIVCLALAGQAVALVVPPSKSLVPHPPPSETLDTSEILDALSPTNFQTINPAQLVAGKLYGAKDKSAAVVGVVSSESLIKQNHIDIAGCTREAFAERLEVFDLVIAERRVPGVNHAIKTYLMDTLLAGAQFCVANKGAAAKQNGDEQWLNQLEQALGYDGISSDDQVELEIAAHDNVWNGFETNIETLVKTGSI